MLWMASTCQGDYCHHSCFSCHCCYCYCNNNYHYLLLYHYCYQKNLHHLPFWEAVAEVICLKQLCRPTKPPFPWQMLPACQITFWLLLKHASPKGCSTGLRLSDSILFSVILCVLLKACLFVFIVLRQKNFHNMVSYPFPLSRCCVKHVISPDFF